MFSEEAYRPFNKGAHIFLLPQADVLARAVEFVSHSVDLDTLHYVSVRKRYTCKIFEIVGETSN